ncbi:MAG: hypothetical protein Q8P31_02345 [Bacillota bacterium]|nr:hypothetical protein [Bacillota bacterium]
MGGRKAHHLPAAVTLSQRAALALALILTMALAAAAAGCSARFELASISAESIPPEARDEPHRAENVVWRTCHKDNGLLIVACTYDLRGYESPGVLGPTFPAMRVSVYRGSEDGSLTSVAGGTCDIGKDVKFRAMPGQGMGSPNGGSLVWSLHAVGMALDARVVKVIGVTTTGRTVEAGVNNGFWGMFVDNTGQHETWASLNAVSAQGKALYRYLDDFVRP